MISKKVKVIGLTGPIGAGKDAVARLLRRRGAYIIDADQLAHEVYRPQTPAWHELVRAFGSKVLMRGGKINRKKLGQIVFSDKNKLIGLNKIVHPFLREEIIKTAESRKRKAMPAGRQAESGIVVINAAILGELKLVDYVDEVWLVTAPRATRLKRLVKKGLSAQEAKQRIRSQADARAYVQNADFIINNTGALKQLNAKVQARLQF